MDDLKAIAETISQETTDIISDCLKEPLDGDAVEELARLFKLKLNELQGNQVLN